MDDKQGLSYFLLGLGIGVAVGFVFAPMSGEDARGRIRTKAVEGGDYLRRRTDELREYGVDLVDRGKTAVGRQREQLNAAVEAGKQAYRETIAEASNAINPEGV